MKLAANYLIIILFFLIACELSTTQQQELIVIQALIYSNEPLKEINITSTYSIDYITQNPPPINNAKVLLQKNETFYSLENSPEKNGNYIYPNNDLIIQPGDLIRIEVDYYDNIAFGEVVMPSTPENLQFIDTVMTDEDSLEQTAIAEHIFMARWNNKNGYAYLIHIKNLEENPIAIYPDSFYINNNYPDRQNEYFLFFETQLTMFELIKGVHLHYYGQHELSLYRVENIDVKAPLTDKSNMNITNGLGYILGLSGHKIFFNINEEKD